MDIKDYGQVVGDVEVEVGELVNGKTGGADKVQGMATGVGGEVTCFMLRQSRRSKKSEACLQLLVWM